MYPNLTSLLSVQENYLNLNLEINNEKLKQENYTKYLGIMIDEKLNWNQHIKQVKIEISKGIGKQNYNKRFLSTRQIGHMAPIA